MSSHARLLQTVPYVLMILLGAIEPLTHLWIHYLPPAHSVPTGLHTGDSGHHLVAMESFANGFTSPFVTCKAPGGSSDVAFFSVPIFLLYGIVGEMGRLMGISPFLFLGLVNGFGGMLLLWTVYRFLRRIAPGEAASAFFIYALGGGVGGLVFVGAWLAGGVTAPGFETWFYRFAQYELIEGQVIAPLLLMPRFYYTLPLALGFAALTALVETDRCRCPGHLFFTGVLFLMVAVINVRLGPLFWAAGVAYLLLGSGNDVPYRLSLAAGTLAPVAAGSALFLWVLGFHPVYQANVASVTRSCALLLPLFFATAFFWLPVAAAIRSVLPALPRWARTVIGGLSGYLAAYVLLYAGHQVWFGNWTHGGDQAAAVMASDGALLALIPAVVLAWRWTPQSSHVPAPSPALPWVTLWFVALLTLSILAVGQGWFLQFAPQRAMVLLGVPLALLAAVGLRHLPPWARRTGWVLILCGGILSQTVAALWFQGPLGRVPGEGPFAYLHYEIMREADARLLNDLPPGTVAVPPWSPVAFGEIVAHRGDHRVLGGPGAMNLGDQPFGSLQEAINAFFRADATDADRRAFVAEWCVTYIYCPDTCPVDPVVAAQFRAAPWLKVIAEEGRGMVLRVDDAGVR